jgi:hypothetical protein
MQRAFLLKQTGVSYSAFRRPFWQITEKGEHMTWLLIDVNSIRRVILSIYEILPVDGVAAFETNAPGLQSVNATHFRAVFVSWLKLVASYSMLGWHSRVACLQAIVEDKYTSLKSRASLDAIILVSWF